MLEYVADLESLWRPRGLRKMSTFVGGVRTYVMGDRGGGRNRVVLGGANRQGVMTAATTEEVNEEL